MRQFLILFLCGTMVSYPVQANQYQTEFEKLNVRMRNEHAPSMVGMKLAQSLYLSNQYLDAMAKRFESQTQTLNAQSLLLTSFVDEMKGYTVEPSLSSYKLFIQAALRHRLLTDLTLANLKQAREVGMIFENQGHFFDNYCEPRMAVLPAPDFMPSLPMGVKEDGSVYTRHRHLFSGKQEGVFTEDPVADGAAIFALSAVLVVGLAYYAVTAGISLAAAVGLFSVQSSGAGIALAGTGVGAVIILVAIAVAVVVSIAITENENRKRKKEAEEKYEQELEDFDNAREWYVANRLTEKEFRTIAAQTCASDRWQKKIEDSRLALLANIDKLKTPLRDLGDMEERLKANDRTVNQIADNFAQGLITLYSAEYVESVRKAILPVAKLSAAVDYANTYIKPQSEALTAFYASHREECFTLQDQLFRSRAELSAKQNLVEESYREDANAAEAFFSTQLPGMVTQILTLFEKRVNRCFEQASTNPGIGPIYDL